MGDLVYSAELEPAEIDFGESAVLTVTLKGRGNLPLVETPTLFPSCADCDSYPPEEDSRVTVDASGIHGSRSWQVTVVPRSWGVLELGAVELTVFDSDTGRYQPQTIGPLDLTVLAPPATPTPVVTQVPAAQTTDGGRVADDVGGSHPFARWLLIGGVLLVGVLVGSAATWLLGRRARVALPPRRPDQTPAERARVLQLTLERWWLDARSSKRGGDLETEMQELRSDLEAVRFAPGRADHSDTVVDLEARLRRLMRRA